MVKDKEKLGREGHSLDTRIYNLERKWDRRKIDWRPRSVDELRKWYDCNSCSAACVVKWYDCNSCSAACVVTTQPIRV